MTKRYVGPDADLRRRREATALDRLADALPVPPLLGALPDGLVLGWVDGVPGQELLVSEPEAVLHEVGALARRVREVDVALLGPGPAGAVLVHGDFGPQNLLLAAGPDGAVSTTALLDWEWLHLGEDHEDLAWAEWTVRTHHPDLVAALPALFQGYGEQPAWALRHAAMRTRCAEISAFVARWAAVGGDDAGVRTWAQRTTATAAFRP